MFDAEILKNIKQWAVKENGKELKKLRKRIRNDKIRTSLMPAIPIGKPP